MGGSVSWTLKKKQFLCDEFIGATSEERSLQSPFEAKREIQF